MRRATIVALVLALALLPAAGRAQSKTLSVPLDGQETDQWCWAATTQMTVAYQGVSARQCDMADRRQGNSNCCADPQGCANPSWPAYQNLGFSANTTTTGTALTWDQLRAQIDANRPSNYAWKWICPQEPCGGHIMVARGYKTVGSTNYVYVNNPWPVGTGETSWITYSEYVSSNNHTHLADIYNIIKN